MLWHGGRAIGICVMSSPAMTLALRNRFFGLKGHVTRASLGALNAQLVCLSRVVMHPTYRGAGLTSQFVRRSCELSGFDWVETLSQIGQVHPLFEKAGFVRVGTCAGPSQRTRAGQSSLYGGGVRSVSRETYEKSLRSQPVYYVWGRRRASGLGVRV